VTDVWTSATGPTELDRLVDDALSIARIPAPTFEEEERIAWLERRLAGAAGVRVRDDVGNLLWTWGQGRPRVLLTAHVDTVFDRSVELDFRRERDGLRGPGIGDNAMAVAMAISVVEELLGEGELAPAAVAFTVGEEGPGNLRGAFAACERLQPDAMIALEGHGLDELFLDAVGSVRASVEIVGPGGHSWADRGRPSALHALLEIAVGLIALSGDGLAVNVGLLSGGRAVNAIADRGQMTVEARSTDHRLLERFDERLGALELRPPLAVTVDLIGRRPAGRLRRDAPLLQVVREVRDELALPNSETAASTDANAGLALGIPAVALGAARGTNMHTTREYIDTSSLALGRRQLAMVLRRLLAPEDGCGGSGG